MGLVNGFWDIPMARLAEAARAVLPQLEGGTSVEQLWVRAAVQAVAEGHLAELPIAELKRLTEPAQIWSSLPPWPAEAIQDRTGCLIDSHRLAIVYDDTGWLEQLDACWDAAPSFIDPLRRLRVRGEIGLGLRPGGPRPFGWTADELWLLAEEGFLLSSAPADRAWQALAKRDLDAARQALQQYDTRMAAIAQHWEAVPEDGLRQVRSYPGAVLQVEPRALRGLIDRAR